MYKRKERKKRRISGAVRGPSGTAAACRGDRQADPRRQTACEDRQADPQRQEEQLSQLLSELPFDSDVGSFFLT